MTSRRALDRQRAAEKVPHECEELSGRNRSSEAPQFIDPLSKYELPNVMSPRLGGLNVLAPLEEFAHSGPDEVPEIGAPK